MNTLSEQVQQTLRASGGRMTAQRRLILQVIETQAGHPTAEEIYQHARQFDERINQSTIYRTLRWLEHLELISPRWFENEPRQERFDPAASASHHHFRCRLCGRIIEFEDPQVDTVVHTLEATAGARVESTSLVLYGVCAACLALEK